MFRTPVPHQLQQQVSLTAEGQNVGRKETRNSAADYRETPGNSSTGGQAGFGKNGGKSHEH